MDSEPFAGQVEAGGPTDPPPVPFTSPSRYNGPNLVLKYDRAQKRLVNIAVDKRSSPYYALRDRQGNAIGVTACDIDGDGREEIYFLNTNNAFSGKGLGPRPLPASHLLPPSTSWGQGLGDPGPPQAMSPPLDMVPAASKTSLCPSRRAPSPFVHEAGPHLLAAGPGNGGP